MAANADVSVLSIELARLHAQRTLDQEAFVRLGVEFIEGHRDRPDFKQIRGDLLEAIRVYALDDAWYQVLSDELRTRGL